MPHTSPPASGPEALLPALYELAWMSLRHQLDLGPAPSSKEAPLLQERGTTSVSLQLGGEAHGAHASLRRTRSLAEDIIFNTRAAASDERFPPLKCEDIDLLTVQIALQSEPEFLDFDNEAELLAQLEPGCHGLHLFACCRNVTQGPQAWLAHPSAVDFLAALKAKAGLAVDHDLSGMMLARYTVSNWPPTD